MIVGEWIRGKSKQRTQMYAMCTFDLPSNTIPFETSLCFGTPFGVDVLPFTSVLSWGCWEFTFLSLSLFLPNLNRFSGESPTMTWCFSWMVTCFCFFLPPPVSFFSMIWWFVCAQYGKITTCNWSGEWLWRDQSQMLLSMSDCCEGNASMGWYIANWFAWQQNSIGRCAWKQQEFRAFTRAHRAAQGTRHI